MAIKEHNIDAWKQVEQFMNSGTSLQLFAYMLPLNRCHQHCNVCDVCMKANAFMQTSINVHAMFSFYFKRAVNVHAMFSLFPIIYKMFM